MKEDHFKLHAFDFLKRKYTKHILCRQVITCAAIFYVDTIVF